MEDILGKIGKNIRRYRTQAKLTQYELAEKVGVHQKYVGNIERGQNTTISVLHKISVALNVKLSDLCNIHPVKQNKKSSLLHELTEVLQEYDEETIEWVIEFVKPMLRLSKKMLT